VLIGLVFEAGWYYAGSCACICGIICRARMLGPCVLPVFNILLMSLFNSFALGPLVGASQHCRNGFFCSFSLILVGTMV